MIVLLLIKQIQIAIDDSGNVYVTGQSTGTGTGLDYATIKYNLLGVQRWASRYKGPPVYTSDAAYSIAVDASGNVYVTGGSSGGATSSDYATIKYNSSGVQRYNGPGNLTDIASTLSIDNSGNVYVGGESMGNGTGYDYAIIKYAQLVGIQPSSNEIPDKFSLSQNYPNPFNPTTNIRFAIPTGSFVKLKVYDILSREIAILVNEQLQPGTYEVDFDGSNFASGIYYYKLVVSRANPLEAGESRETKKMILLK